MAYCRFSSDDWTSDVYVYESDCGHEIHVAARRHVFRKPLPEPIVLSDPPTEGEIEALLERHQVVSAMLRDDADLVAIDHPRAGDSYTCDGPAEALEMLQELSSEGFHVPVWALDALAEEAAENDGPDQAAMTPPTVHV